MVCHVLLPSSKQQRQREKNLVKIILKRGFLEPKSNTVIETIRVFGGSLIAQYRVYKQEHLGVAVGMLVCQGTTLMIGEWPKTNTEMATLDLHVLSSTKRL